MVMHLATARDSSQPYCKAALGQKSRVTTSAVVVNCLSCLRAALNESQSGLQVICGVLRQVGLA